MTVRIRAGRRGDGVRCSPLFQAWVGYPYAGPMACVDGKGLERLLDHRLYVAEQNHSTVGVLLISPPMSVLTKRHGQDVTAFRADETYRHVRKLQAVGVDPAHRGEGIGTELVQFALDRVVRPAWVYGQCDAGTGLTAFYERQGFGVRLPGERVTGAPHGMNLAGIREEHWFEQSLQ